MQIRNLLTYLGERNVTTVLVSVQHGLLGAVDTPAGYISYLADTVVLLRYYEHQGRGPSGAVRVQAPRRRP